MIRNAKRYGAIALTVTMLMGTGTVGAFAQSDKEIPATPLTQAGATESVKNESANYIAFDGEVTNVHEFEGGYEITVKGANDTIRFNIGEDTTVLKKDKSKFKVGDMVSAVYGKNQPMTMSIPALTNAQVVLGDVEGTVKATVLDKDYLSADKDLLLNISKDTKIVDLKGNKVAKEEIVGKDVLVNYTVTTKSIPAQTNPLQIIVLADRENTEQAPETDVKMIPIREEAEKLGYKVEWKQESQGVVIAKEGEAMSITIRVGDVNYAYNRANFQFEKAPEVIDGKTYVQSSILELLQ